MKKRKMGGLFTFPMIASSIILLIILLASIFGTLIAPYDPDAIDLANTISAPTDKDSINTACIV